MEAFGIPRGQTLPLLGRRHFRPSARAESPRAIPVLSGISILAHDYHQCTPGCFLSILSEEE
jgi:hypothetical protein